MNKFQLSENFSLHEFQCRHCGQVKLDSRLVQKLQALRDEVGVPLVITSGFRCLEHNQAVGGADGSQHLFGRAADVVIPEGMSGEKFADIGRKVGFTGIGVYSSFVHMDVRPGRYVRFK